MASVTILSDNGATSGSAGLKTAGGNDGTLLLQTTTAGGTPTTAISISNTQVVTFANQPTYTGGTANGVLYLNGSKVVTSGSALVFDGNRLFVGTTSGVSDNNLKVNINTTASNTNAFYSVGDDGGYGLLVGYVYNDQGNIRTVTNKPLVFGTNNTERARIEASGNLLLGGTSNGANARMLSENATGNQLGLRYTGIATWYNSIDSSGNYIWTKDGTEKARIDSSGNFGLGISPSAWGSAFKAFQSGSSGYQSSITFQTNDAVCNIFSNAYYDGASYKYINSSQGATQLRVGDNGSVASSGFAVSVAASGTAGAAISWIRGFAIDSAGSITFGDGGGYGYIKQFGSYLGLGNGNTALMFLDESSSTRRVIPRQNNNGGSDGNLDLGDGGSRFRTLYATTGSINTSDAREKTAVISLSSDELAAASQIAFSIGTYQWLQAVEEKGVAARHHAGLTVQRAIEIMEANNLNPFSYGFICYDTWPEEKNEDGLVTKEAGDRYSFRMDQLSLFISRGQQAIITQLQADVASLKGQA